jgi:DNA-damage-inducible protein D
MKFEQNQLPLVFSEPKELATEQDMVPTHTFEDFASTFGEGKKQVKTWWASELAQMLGYADTASFSKPMQRAKMSCLSINIECDDDFIRERRVEDGVPVDDYRLTRFACYMIAMNADAKKPQVAAAQVYFAKVAAFVDVELDGSNDVDRIIYRDNIKEGNKALASAAKMAGVTKFGIFADCGYRGLYNMPLKKLEQVKGVKSGQLLDYMGRTELSANLFRVTMTEERLKKDNVKHEQHAYRVHKEVGQKIRATVKENTGQFPEELAIERRLGDASKALKLANKRLNK